MVTSVSIAYPFFIGRFTKKFPKKKAGAGITVSEGRRAVVPKRA
jgi:hypothetical protein